MITPEPILSAGILLCALLLFVSEKVRHDLVAVAALIACVAAGLVRPEAALAGFGDPAVIAVAAVLVVGRALELTGVAARAAHLLVPAKAAFSVKLGILMGIAALLSAFMNNIAALVITMPLAAEIARASRTSPAATLMPLAFATILGGMTTLIGTPANLILSSVRERELGVPFGFFDMTMVGGPVCLAGLAYLTLLGWRLLPIRQAAISKTMRPWQIFELRVLRPWTDIDRALSQVLRSSKARVLARFRNHERRPHTLRDLAAGDTLLLVSRAPPREVGATLAGFAEQSDPRPGTVNVRMVVANGSPLIGQGYHVIDYMSDGALSVTAAGPRAALRKQPLATMQIQPGDQLFVEGQPADLARHAAKLRLLEIDRSDNAPVEIWPALATLLIFGGALGATVFADVTPAISFLVAAALVAGAGLISPNEVYTSIDWSVVVLLAAMIPVGASFETSGAASIVASSLGDVLAGVPLFAALAAICAATLILSIFLNNVATSVIMGPLAIKVAAILHIDPDAMLLAVLVGASSDFLTPIGHQNNLLVMGPGGYRFSDYARAGAILSVLVVLTASAVLSGMYHH